MKLASADFSWPGLPIGSVYDLIAALDLEGATLAFFGGFTERTPQMIAEEPEGWAQRIGDELQERGLSPADAFFVPNADLAGMAVNHPDPREREAGDALFEPFCRFAAAIGTTGVTILPGLTFAGESGVTALQRSAEQLKPRFETARKHGLALSVEPHIVSTQPFRGSVADTPAKVEELLDLVPGLELTLDYGHFNVQGIPDREVERLIDHARHMHLRGGAPGLVQTKFEDNVTDFGRVIDLLDARDYSGWLEIEYVHDERPGCSDCDCIQEIRKFRDFVRERSPGDSEPT
jgi:sugar phosphate isomerase/epimerase